MTAAEDGDQDAAWLTFADVPSAYIDPERLRGLLGSGVSMDICNQLKRSARVQRRLSSMIADRCELPPLTDDAVDERDKSIALAVPSQVLSLVNRAGAIYWSGAFSNVVRRNDVAELQALIGEELYQFAINHRDLGAPRESTEPLDTIPERMRGDGWRCYAAWCDGLAAPVALRARLKAPPGVLEMPLSDHIKAHGAEILRRTIV